MDKFIGFNTDDGKVYINMRNVVSFGSCVEDDRDYSGFEAKAWVSTVTGMMIYVADDIETIIETINKGGL